MRGTDTKQASMFTVLSPEKRVPKDHPLRRLKQMCDEALRQMSPLFDAMYSTVGRPSIPPERLLKSTLLMALYTVRSERLFCEQLDYNILFRWFLDMSLDEESFDHSSFTRNRDRLLLHDIAKEFFCTVVEQARAAGLLSNEHFSVDGTLIEAWASAKSFRKKGLLRHRSAIHRLEEEMPKFIWHSNGVASSLTQYSDVSNCCATTE